MRVQVFTQDPSLPPAFREFVELKVGERLARLAERLTSVEVHVKDLNGQKNGIDKRCVIEARPRGMDPLAASADAAEARDAVTAAAEKIERVLQKRFERRA